MKHKNTFRIRRTEPRGMLCSPKWTVFLRTRFGVDVPVGEACQHYTVVMGHSFPVGVAK